jgi:hypothetical protein
VVVGVCVFVGVLVCVGVMLGVGVLVLVGVGVGVAVVVGVTNGLNAALHLSSGDITLIFNIAFHPPHKSLYLSKNGIISIVSSR